MPVRRVGGAEVESEVGRCGTSRIKGMELEAGVIIAVVSLAVSIISLVFTYSQVRVATKTTKAEIAITLIDQLYSDKSVQSLLQRVYGEALTIRRTQSGSCEVFYADGDSEIDATSEIDSLLNRFQIIGHLFNIGVLQVKDLQGLRYEILCLGRDRAIQAYLGFLATDYQALSGIRHDHFGYFKKLYMAFEYDPSALKVMNAQTALGRTRDAERPNATGNSRLMQEADAQDREKREISAQPEASSGRLTPHA